MQNSQLKLRRESLQLLSRGHKYGWQPLSFVKRNLAWKIYQNPGRAEGIIFPICGGVFIGSTGCLDYFDAQIHLRHSVLAKCGPKFSLQALWVTALLVGVKTVLLVLIFSRYSACTRFSYIYQSTCEHMSELL